MLSETTTSTAQLVGEPDYPKDRTCPYAIPDEYVTFRDEDRALRRVTLYDGRQAWLVTGFQTARSLLIDPRISSDRTDDGFPFLHPSAAALRWQPPSFIHMDDPEHTVKRKMVSAEFTVKRVKAMRPNIERIVNGFIDELLAAGSPADFVPIVSLPVPSLVICELLGVPFADHDLFQDASQRLVQATDPDDAMAARRELMDYLESQVDSRMDDPGPGLLGTLVRERLLTGEIDRSQLVAKAVLMLIAGHETTASMISLSVLMLLEHPEQYAALREDRSLIPGAVDELLRYLSIVDISGVRVAKEDIEIDGVTIRAGDGVVISKSIANRDGTEFENPDTFDVRRSTRHHMSFGFGTHQCLGHNLARVELGVVIEALIDRLPTLALDVPVAEIGLRPGTTIQGVNSLPVRW